MVGLDPVGVGVEEDPSRVEVASAVVGDSMMDGGEAPRADHNGMKQIGMEGSGLHMDGFGT